MPIEAQEEFIMSQTLIGQVYKVEGFDYTKTVAGVKEKRRRVEFRLGMPKPYKEMVGTEEKRQSSFLTVKCFNGLSESIEKYFGGEENKGRWIQLQGHYEENKYERILEVEDPEDANRVLEIPVPTTKVEFIVSGFNFIGNAPEQSAKPKAPEGPTKVKVKTKVKGAPVSADEVVDDGEAPF